MARPIVWPLVADPRGWNRGFDQAERRGTRFQRHIAGLERSNTRFSASLGHLGPVAVRAMGGATVAIGGLAAAGAVLGLKTAANLETAEVGFTRLLKSGKAARSFLGDLKSFAARTPFELPGLIDAARGLVGAGTAAKNVIPILTALGDASGALGLDQERFGRVMTATTQIMNKGKVQAEELMQITEAGIPVWQLLAKATGKPIPELQKLMQQGKLLAKDVLPALFRQMRKDYGGGMAQQSKTLNGLWSTFKDTVSLTLADALQPLIPVLKTALPAAGEAFQRSMKGLTDFFRSDLAPELSRIKLAWDENRVSAGNMGAGLVDVRSDAQELVHLLGDLGVGLANLSGKLGELDEKTQPGNTWAERLGRLINEKVVKPAWDASFGADALTRATDQAALAADRHARALRSEKSALEALQGALGDEKTAELDLRQAKLNVQTAQKRLNDLKGQGKTKSFEYKQAQLDLERAQIDLRHKTDEYKSAQLKANSATASAMIATQRASVAHRKFVDAAGDAGRAGRKFGDRVRDGILMIPKGRIIVISGKARLDSQRLFFSTASAAIRERPRAAGGPIIGPGTGISDSIPAIGPRGVRYRLSDGEHVWTAAEVRKAGGHGAMAALRAQVRGLVAGGAVGLRFQSSGVPSFRAGLRRWYGDLQRSVIDAAKWDLTRAFRQGIGRPGIQAFIRSVDPLPYIWGGAGPGGYDCSGLVSAVLGKATGRGGGHGQRYFTTSSIRAGILGIKPGLGGMLQIGVTPGQGHMAGMYGGLKFEARSTRSGIIVGAGARHPASFARHFHLARGGPVDERLVEMFTRLADLDVGGDQGRLRVNGKVLDQGGWLMPGQVGVNRTSQPERVMAPGEPVIDRQAARMIAEELVGAMRAAGLGAVYLDRQKVSKAVATGALLNERLG